MLMRMSQSDPREAASELGRLLDTRNEHPESLTAIDAEIWERFGHTKAVLVLDMCGFSRLTMRHGITHFLSMIRRLGVLVRPVVATTGGRVVKAEADNLFAVFDDMPAALSAARTIQDRLSVANTFLPEDWDLHASIGLGYGPTLLVGDHDLFGAEVNVASKLGEDVAGAGEILLSQDAHQRLAPSNDTFEELALEISGLNLRAFKLKA